jgi:hypothetical protein
MTWLRIKYCHSMKLRRRESDDFASLRLCENSRLCIVAKFHGACSRKGAKTQSSQHLLSLSHFDFFEQRGIDRRFQLFRFCRVFRRARVLPLPQ